MPKLKQVCPYCHQKKKGLGMHIRAKHPEMLDGGRAAEKSWLFKIIHYLFGNIR